MVMTLVAPASGKIFYQALEGSPLSSGDMIARLELDNPDAAQQITQHTGGFPELGPPLVYSSKVDQKFKTAFTAAKNVLQGRLHCPILLCFLMMAAKCEYIQRVAVSSFFFRNPPIYSLVPPKLVWKGPLEAEHRFAYLNFYESCFNTVLSLIPHTSLQAMSTRWIRLWQSC